MIRRRDSFAGSAAFQKLARTGGGGSFPRDDRGGTGMLLAAGATGCSWGGGRRWSRRACRRGGLVGSGGV